MIDPNFPLIDLHRHLDGSVRIETILELGRKYNLPLPAWDIENLKPYVQITGPQPGIMSYIAKFEWMVGILVNYTDCQRIAFENVEDAKKEGLDYVELRFSPWFMAEPHGLNPVGIVDSVINGVNEARREFDIEVNLIGIISRTYGPDSTRKELNALLNYRDDIVAIDLAGDEANFPGELFVDHIKLARDAGWHVTIHAGEAAGADSIWQAIKGLGAERIGHGVHADDAAGEAFFFQFSGGHECVVNGLAGGDEGDVLSVLDVQRFTDLKTCPWCMQVKHGTLAKTQIHGMRHAGSGPDCSGGFQIIRRYNNRNVVEGPQYGNIMGSVMG